jgi:DNA polymerase-3 subunit delta'
MLEEYKDIDNIVYMELKGTIKKGLSHAYLFNMNDNIYAENMIMAFVKSVLCEEKESIDDVNNRIKCDKIDSGNFVDLKKIFPDGLWIKKEQIDDLQSEFSKKSVESNKKIYIIYEVEKLNKSGANSLLKFLEEPENGIIGILLTNNINLVLNTIVSRCQLINFRKNNLEEYKKSLISDNDLTINKIMFSVFKISDIQKITVENKKFVEDVIKFIKCYEENGKKSILTIKNNVSDYIEDKNLMISFFECLILFYRDVLEYILYKKVNYFDNNINLIEKVAIKNNLEKVISKLNKIVKFESYIKSNANMNLLIDSLILNMEDSYD